MIAERQSGIKTEGNLTGQSFQAGIDDEDMEWVIGLFTDLYSDPQKAVVREYPTNARDAQIEAGYDGPIEITLPTALAPFFKVKDYGVGLTAEDIQRVYSRYGRSTKRASNDVNGMLGMGCKSALAYCEQFTVESVKDGMRTICSISRTDEGVPVFTVLASQPDDAPNGTEVIVPVQRNHHADFANKAAEFFSYWEEGTVLVNGEEPTRIEGLDLGDGLTLMKKDGYMYGRKANLIVMGGVAYPVDEDKLDLGLPTNYWLVARVPMGAVAFAPSREALNYDKRVTKDTLALLKPKIAKAVEKAVQAEISKADTYRGAIQTMLQWRDLMGGGNVGGFTFKGKKMPALIEGEVVHVPWRGYKQTSHDVREKGIQPEYLANCLIISDYTNATFTATTKKKLMQYTEDADIDQPEGFLLYNEVPDTDWIEDDRVVPWEDIKAVKLTATASTYGWRSGRPTGSYDAYIGGQRQHVQADEIDQNEPVYYCHGYNKYEAEGYATLIGQFFPDATVVCLPRNRYDKFMRNFPDAKPYKDGLQKAYDDWSSGLTRGQRLALAINDGGDWSAFSTLDPSKVEDPAIRKACLIARNVNLQALTNARRRFNNVLHRIDTAKVTTQAAPWTDPLSRYKLLQHTTYRSPWSCEHIYHYLNAAYAAMEAEAATA